MAPSLDGTRLQLVRAAERLFAERGVGAVSLTEVSKAAGQANQSAAHYHFGDKTALLDALLERHSEPIQHGWMATLDHLEASDSADLRALISVLVRPIAAKLDDPDGGPEFIAISAQLTGDPTYQLIERPIAQTNATRRITGLIVERIDLPPQLLPLRMQRIASIMYHGIANYHRFARGVIARELFIEELIDSLHAFVAAPISSQTARALREPNTTL